MLLVNGTLNYSLNEVIITIMLYIYAYVSYVGTKC